MNVDRIDSDLCGNCGRPMSYCECPPQESTTCWRCRGTGDGHDPAHVCPECNGTGKLPPRP